jgi:hypothetical protein
VRRSFALVALGLLAACDDTPAGPDPINGSVAVFSGPDLTPSVYAAPGARAVNVVDLDGDGHLDMVVAGNDLTPLTVLDGSNHFSGTYYGGAWATGVATVDVDGDGLLDVVAGNFDRVSVYRNLGDGVLDAPQSLPIAGGYLVVGDFDGDGRPDIAAGIETDFLTILLNRGGVLEKGEQLRPQFGPWRIATADVNEDGILDLVTTDYSAGFTGTFGDTFSVLLGHGDGTFADPIGYQVGDGPWEVAVADIDGDHHVDVIIEQRRNIVVFKGAGDATFTLARTTPLPRQEFAPIAVGPCTATDCQLFIAGTTLQSLQLADPTSVPVERASGTGLNGPWQLLVTDADGDSVPDVVVANSAGGASIP